MGYTRSLGWSVVLAVLLVTACGARQNLNGIGQQAKLLNAGSIVTDVQTDTAGVASERETCAFTLDVAPETYVGCEAVELSLDLDENQDGVTATISTPKDSELTALCASISYDADVYTPVEVEWLAGFARSDSSLAIVQLAIPGTAYLGCVPAAGTEPTPCSGALARVCFARGSAHGKHVNAVPIDTGIIQDERINLLDKTLCWNYFLQGDYDENGEVSYADLMLIAEHYLETPTQETGDIQYGYKRYRKDLIQYQLDYIQNGEINQADILGLVRTFGQRIVEWRVYTSPSTTGYPNASQEASGITEFATIPFSDIDRGKISGNHYVASLPTLPEDVNVCIRPTADGSFGAPSGMLYFSTEGLSSIRLEYDEELMQYYGGLPEQTTLSFWAEPGADLLVQMDASSEPEVYQGNIYYDGTLLAPSPNLAAPGQFSVDSNFSIHTLSVDKQTIRFSIPRALVQENEFCLTMPLLRESEQRLTHQFSEGVLRCGPYIVNNTSHYPNIPFDADPAWDSLDHTFSWLYCGYGDATQDGCCLMPDDLAFIPLFMSRYDLEIESIEYLADFDHNSEVSIPDLTVLAVQQNHAHDGYNMYYKTPEATAELTYAGHIALSDGVGNRYTERLRFTFQYPPAVGPGYRLYYRPTLGDAEGELALLYTVPGE